MGDAQYERRCEDEFSLAYELKRRTLLYLLGGTKSQHQV